MILVLNCGSQSIKWKVFSSDLKLKKEGAREIFKKGDFVKILKKELKSLDGGITLIGHRVVHGGNKFKKPTEVTNAVLKEIKSLSKLAPLHNPFNLLGIKIAKRVFPKAKNIAVFDTAFYTSLPEKAYNYALPEELRKKYRRFGFHGISHEYVAQKVDKESKKKIISCHLGGGSSITAIKNGKAIDTSMGFTPMEGLIMMTRSGDIDPGIVLELGKKAKYILNYQSGIKGISGHDNMLDLLKSKNKLALDMYIYRIQKYIGAYNAILGGCDVLVFTGTIGYGSAKIRKMASSVLKAKVIAIKPDEELAIAKKIRYNK